MRILILSLLGILLSGCGDGSKLSRGKAKDLIGNHEAFKIVTEDIPDRAPRFAWNGVAPAGYQLWEVIDAMAKAELASYAMPPGMVQDYTHFQIILSESGKKHVLAVEKRPGRGAEVGPATWSTVRLCERQIAEVSGIEQPGTQEAVVHFTYTTGNPTPFGKLAPKVCSGEVREGKAVMALFDDGWRVRRVSTSEPRPTW